MTNSNILPGLVNNSLEIFVVDSIAKAIHKGKVIDLTELPIGVIELLKEAIKKDKDLELALHDWHPHSQWKRIEQFATCRFGGLDYNDDITASGELSDGEYVDCPNRGNCPYEGIVCKLPVVNGHRLTNEEIELMKLSTTELTNEAIADKLKMPLGSYHKGKANIHQILKVQTKQGITKVCNYLGLI